MFFNAEEQPSFQAMPRNEQLQLLLTKFYSGMGNNNPHVLRNLVPPQELWRFFMEGSRQKISSQQLYTYPMFNFSKQMSLEAIAYNTPALNPLFTYLCLTKDEKSKIKLEELATFNTGWFFFERHQPGYFKSLTLAFDGVFVEKKTLELPFILQLHKAGLEHTSGTNYELLSGVAEKGAIRNKHTMTYGLSPFTHNKKGIVEYLERRQNLKNLSVIINQQIYLDYLEYPDDFFMSEDCPAEIKQAVQAFQQMKPDLCKQFLDARGDIYAMADVIANAVLRGQAIQFSSSFFGDTRLGLEQCALQYIETFNEAMSTEILPLEKLRHIVRVVQDLEQLHMFEDGNVRTLCMLLLNHLLINHGFPLCILNEPNCFDAFSEDRLITEVILGMHNTFELIQKGQLFDVKTEDLIAKSKLPNSCGFNEKMLETLVDIENLARAMRSTENNSTTTP